MLTSEGAALGVDYFYPNKMVRIILLALEEVMGRNGVSAVLNLAGVRHLVNNYPPNNFDRQVTFAEVGAMMGSLDRMFGPRSGRGLALRAGRACFKYGLKEFEPGAGLGDLSFRLLPLPIKLKVGSDIFRDVFNTFSDQVVQLAETDDRYVWENVRCPVCWGRKAAGPCCFLAVGLLQEALYWVSGGKTFEVYETTCAACGDDMCRFVIEKKPLD